MTYRRSFVNIKRPSERLRRRYQKEKALYVDAARALVNKKIVRAALLRKGDFIRHDSDKLARVICFCPSNRTHVILSRYARLDIVAVLSYKNENHSS